jgi:hypothetical protein
VRLALLGLAACNLGLGSDPNGGPQSSCLAGNVRGDAGCFVPAAAIAIDGTTDDWADVPSIAVAPPCLDAPCSGLTPATIQVAASGQLDASADLFVTVAFDGAPPTSDPTLRAVIGLAASELQPASGGSDRLSANVAGIQYEKSGFVVGAPGLVPYHWAWTADGFEAAIDGVWLAYQGAGNLVVTIERDHGGTWEAVAPTDALTICWGWRSALGAHACEAQP